MPPSRITAPYICARCLRANRHTRAYPAHPSIRRVPPIRRFADSAPQPKERDKERDSDYAQLAPDHASSENRRNGVSEEKDEGAMTRRLRDMSEEALASGGRSSQKAVLEAGFSEDLKRQLEERIASASFKAGHRNAFVESELPSHAGRGSRDIATAQAWTGEESLHDASLRMLNDAHKPLRFPARAPRLPGPAAPPPRSIDTGRRSGKAAAGTRLANARDRSGLYSSLKDSEIDEAEREKRFQELKDKFKPDARAVVPGTIQGLANLANQRIEDAIARGQFKNLPRGQKIERDHNASSPFLDTTEYFMNKLIKKQDIVPPWIEKQQELVSTATKFRSRLRNDWKRHAARMIASKGGTLQEQMRRAEAYAKAELVANPTRRKKETINMVDDSGHLSQISLSGETKVPDSASEGPVTEEVIATKTTVNLNSDDAQSSTAPEGETTSQSVDIPISAPPPATEVPPAPYPFRDPTWEANEHSYLSLSINDLNSKTRSYNLQAPDLAKKPYFSLTRELNACYADVAPQLAEVIKERALAPRKVQSYNAGQSGSGGGVLSGLVGQKVTVRDELAGKQYGFRQLWNDVFGREKA